MKEYIASTYGDHLADVYDEWFASYEDAAIDALTELAQGGRVLELGIGTGRVALPLAARGIEIYGIDASEAMVSKLRARPRGDSIRVTMGNFADVEVEGEFSLVYIVFNTFFALLKQEEQVRCFRNVAVLSQCCSASPRGRDIRDRSLCARHEALYRRAGGASPRGNNRAR